MKRIKQFLFSLLMIAALISGIGISAKATGTEAETDTVTRAQWLSKLAETFEMTVEAEAYPDNYFSDLNSESEYYYDILLNVEFGVIDVPAGGEVRPDDPVTREFAVETLNFCLGFELDEGTEYTFSDAEELPETMNPDNVQIALNRGWVELIDGAFSAETYITSAEMDFMMEDAAAVLASDVVNENYESTYEFAAGVIEVPASAEVEVSVDGVVTITNLEQTIAAGDKFAVYQDGIPSVYEAVEVSEDGENTIITTTSVSLEEAYENIDAQEMANIDLTQVEAANGGEIIFIDDETGEEYTNAAALMRAAQARGVTKLKSTIKEKLSVDIASGVTAELELTLKDMAVFYGIDYKEVKAYAYLDGNMEVTCKIQGDLAAAAGFDEICVMTIGVPGVGGISIYAELEASGSIALVNAYYLKAGVSCSLDDGFRQIKTFQNNKFSLVAEAAVAAGVSARLGVTDLPVLDAYVYAKGGAKASVAHTAYEEGSVPAACDHFAAYVYASYGAEASVEFPFYKKTKNVETVIYDDSNSPYRIVHHYEDDVEVAKCTCGNGDANGYYTNSSSIFGGSGWSGGTNSKGLNSSGEPFAIYTYTVDDAGNATITDYLGSAAALVIPATLDGHPVTAIGVRAFEKCMSIRSVVIPDAVTWIGLGAFAECWALESVSLPDSLETIGTAAFINCYNLENVIIPKNLKYFRSGGVGTGYHEEGAFQGCSSLRVVVVEEGTTSIVRQLFAGCTGIKSLVIPESVTTIESSAFAGCTNLRDLDLSNVTTIADSAFANCTALTEVTIPNSVTYIGPKVFKECKRLETITIADSVTNIDLGAFESCTSLKNVTLSKNLVQIGSGAFNNCTALAEIEIPKSLVNFREGGVGTGYYLDGVFQNCSSLKNVTFEKGTTKILKCLFRGCNGLESITIPDTVTVIEVFALSNCANLTDVNISKSVTTIAKEAFCNCDNLVSVQIPEGVTTIDARVFAECAKLKKVTMADNVTDIGLGVFDSCESLTDVKLSKNLTTIGSGAFNKCTALAEIELPKSLVNFRDGGVGTGYNLDGVFQNCSSLKNVKFEEGTTKILKCLFRNCPGLEKIVVPDTVTVIEGFAFQNCTALSDVTIPDSVTEIGQNAFRGCTVLKEITIPQSVTAIGADTFYDCVGLKKIELPNGLTKLSERIFYNCTALTEIELPENLVTICSSAFENAGLKKIVIPDTVTKIESVAFKNCDSLTEAIMGANLINIEYRAFYDCDALKNVALNENLTTIWNEVFNDCDAIVEITIPDSVTSMGSGVFENCDLLETVNFGTGLKEIPIYTFNQCPKLNNVVLPYRIEKINNYAFANSTGLTAITIPRATTTISDTAFSYPAQLTIYGISGTYAEEYANAKNITFVNKEVNATEVTLTPSTLEMNKGASATLKMSIVPANFTDLVTWESSDTSIVTINDSGLVTAKGLGEAIVRVTVGNVTAKCDVTVVQPVTGISLNRTSYSMNAGETFQLNASVRPTDATNQEIAWSTSDEAVVSVDENGLVTAVSKGTAAITVAAQDGSGVTAVCEVTVNNNRYFAESIEELESPHDYENNSTDFWVYTRLGAEALNVTFDERTEVEESFDFIYIYDAEGTEVGKYTGTELSGATIKVPGDSVIIQLSTGASGTAWGFKVTEIEEPVMELPFTDVPESAWYYSYVKYVYENGLMAGTGDGTTFAPTMNLSRSQFATILWRINGSPKVEYSNVFSDVPADKWYTDAVIWANQAKVVLGKGDGTFGIDDNITREQMALMMYRYAALKEYDVTQTTDLSKFSDSGKLDSWAVDAMKWAVANKIINGKNGDLLDPLGNATRAECATIIKNFTEAYN